MTEFDMEIDGLEPQRLRDHSDSRLERALLTAGTSYRSSPETRTRTLAALGVAATATTVAAVAATSAAAATTAGGASALATSSGALGTGAAVTGTVGTVGSTSAMSMAIPIATTSALAKLGSALTSAKLLATLAVAGAGIAVPVTYQHWHRQHQATHVARAVPVRASTASPAAPKPAAAMPAPAPAATPVDVPDTAPPAARAPARTATKGLTLTQELVALDSARARLVAGDPQGALSLLATYQRAYPHGNLMLEAEVLRIDALARVGRQAEARRRATAFLNRHGNSPLAARVRTAVDE